MTRLELLRKKLTASSGKPGLAVRCREIRKEIARLEQRPISDEELDKAGEGDKA